jgi:hypothetical protein
MEGYCKADNRKGFEGNTRQIRKALTDSYPFGPRQYHPYKVWLDEIKIQRDKRQFGQRVHRDENNPNQLNIL